MRTLRLLVRPGDPVRIWPQHLRGDEWHTVGNNELTHAEWIEVEAFCRRHGIEIRTEAEVA
jgi:hypothetical protein